MKIILVGDQHSRSRTVSLGRLTRAILSLCVLGLPLGAGVAIGYNAGQHQQAALADEALAQLRARVQGQQAEVDELRQSSGQQLQALTVRLAELQARLVRLDALGERMTGLAQLDDGEFDFSQPPALGGPEVPGDGVDLQEPLVLASIERLAASVDDRARQLGLLQDLLVNRRLEDNTFIAGRPVRQGWMSSRFGQRTDPFTGRPAFHQGVDFAGKPGSDIVAVAAGVVTWSGERHGYGKLVEISHGGSYVTRYAHNRENLVQSGDIVKKGQVVALMGASGRATGPHVHFEVYKHGRAVDPASYIHRAAR